MNRHDRACLDDDGTLDECVCGLDDPQPEPWPDDYSDPLLDREPMGGDPYWRDE